MPRLPIVAFAFGAAAFLGISPVMAQDPGEKVNQVIVFGDDPCPQSAEGEITVCARKEESERFRIPQALRDTPTARNDSWSNRVVAYETVGAAGTLSCSPVGAGGSTGCTQKLIDAAFAEKRGASDVRFSQLIQEEREKRLSTIDAEAAETQQRVEEIEKQYEARERAAQDGQAGDAPATTAPAVPSPGTATPAPVVAPAARP